MGEMYHEKLGPSSAVLGRMAGCLVLTYRTYRLYSVKVDIKMERYDMETAAIDKRISEIIRILQTSTPSDQPTPRQLALRVNLSQSRLSHLFQVATGTTMARFTRNRRLSAATVLLQETFQSTKQIANAVGFNDYKRFLRYFRAHNGQSPSQVRRLASLASVANTQAASVADAGAVSGEGR